MIEPKKKKSIATVDEEIDAVVSRESEEALKRFRAGDFTARLNARLASPPTRRPGLAPALPILVFFRKPVLAASLGFCLLAAAATVYFFASKDVNSRRENGIRLMTEALAHTNFYRAGGLASFPDETEESSAGSGPGAFARVLHRALAETGAGSSFATSIEGGAPLRPLFNSKERFKILFEDRAILKVLTALAKQKEV